MLQGVNTFDLNWSVKVFLGYLIFLFPSVCISQLTLEWSHFQDGSDAHCEPKIEIDSNQELVLVYDAIIHKFDSLGNELWFDSLPGYTCEQEAWNGNDHFVIDPETDEIFVTSSELQGYFENDLLSNCYVSKYSPNGVLQWEVSVVDSSVSPKYTVASISHSQDNILVTGKVSTQEGYWDIYLFSLNKESGQQNWVTYYDDGDFDADRSIRVRIDSEENILVAGRSSTNSNNEYLLLKFTPLGDLSQISRFENEEFNFTIAQDLEILNNGSAVITGHYHSTALFTDNFLSEWDHHPESNLPLNVTADLAYDIQKITDDSFFVTGYYTENYDIITDGDLLIERINVEGNVQWSAKFIEGEDNQFSRGKNITITPQGNPLVVGRTLFFEGVGVSGPDHFLIVEFDAETGTELWSFVDEENYYYDEDAFTSIMANSSSLYVAGVASDSKTRNLILKKYRRDEVGINEQNSAGLIQVKVLSNYLTVFTKNYLGEFEAKLFDVKGVLIGSKKGYDSLEFDLNTLSPGIYLINATANQHAVVHRILVL
jgi:hypothetical protein